jgi:hypothetical protein
VELDAWQAGNLASKAVEESSAAPAAAAAAAAAGGGSGRQIQRARSAAAGKQGGKGGKTLLSHSVASKIRKAEQRRKDGQCVIS